MKKIISIGMMLILCMTMLFALGACGTEKDGGGSSLSVEETGGQWASLEGKSLMIYCGAGMKQPFAEISDNFKAATGADVQVTYGNAAQIVSQITTTDQGDLFIAGAEGELAPLQEKDYVSDSKKLVKHIPVIAVPKGNPAGIQSIADQNRGRSVKRCRSFRICQYRCQNDDSSGDDHSSVHGRMRRGGSMEGKRCKIGGSGDPGSGRNG